MREIKFRAWDKEGYMMEVLAINWEEKTLKGITTHYPFGEGDQQTWTDKLENFELMQYTGLTDKNGKEIYEGDIIKDQTGNNWEVYYDMGQFLLKNKLVLNQPISLWEEPIKGIIGNIYENKELLK